MRRFAAAFFALALLSISSALWAAGNGTTGMSILRVPMGARPLGMGAAFTGMDGDLDSIDYNPAGLGSIRRLETSGLFSKGFEDTGVEQFAAGAPLPWKILNENEPAVLTVQGLFSQEGSLQFNQTNPDGSLLSQSNISAGSDMILEASLSQLILRQSFLTEGQEHPVEHYLGGTVKYLHSSLAETYSASAGAFDVGYLAKLPKLNLAFGASVLNVGSQVKFISVGDPLPTSMRLGLAWKTPLNIASEKVQMTFAGDLNRFVQEGDTREQLGVEALIQKFFTFRMGYGFGQTGSGFSMGFGVKNGKFSFDYAWVPSSLFSASHRFGLKASLDLPWPLNFEHQIKAYQGVLDAPSTEEQPKSKEKAAPIRKKQRPEEEMPLLPGWIR